MVEFSITFIKYSFTFKLKEEYLNYKILSITFIKVFSLLNDYKIISNTFIMI